MNKNKVLVGIKGYETTRRELPAEEVIGVYSRLLKIIFARALDPLVPLMCTKSLISYSIRQTKLTSASSRQGRSE